jgi:hypothetical protein
MIQQSNYWVCIQRKFMWHFLTKLPVKNLKLGVENFTFNGLF